MRGVPSTQHRRIQRTLNVGSFALNLRRIFPRTGRFDGERSRNRPTSHTRNSSGDVELAFLGDPFESLGRVFDPVLAVIAVGRKQTDHLIGAAGGRTGDIAGSEIDGLSNGELVLQRPSPRKNAGRAYGPANFGRLKPHHNLAQRRALWPVTSGYSKYANSAGSSVR